MAMVRCRDGKKRKSATMAKGVKYYDVGSAARLAVQNSLGPWGDLSWWALDKRNEGP